MLGIMKSVTMIATALVSVAVLAGVASAQFVSPENTHTGTPSGACGYYVNRSGYGHPVARPCLSSQGATALCADGRYSYSEHPSSPMTCSYHGGVAQRLR